MSDDELHHTLASCSYDSHIYMGDIDDENSPGDTSGLSGPMKLNHLLVYMNKRESDNSAPQYNLY